MMNEIINKLKNILRKRDGFYSRLEKEGKLKYDPITKSYIKNIFGNSFYLNPNDFGLSRDLALNGIREKESTEMMIKCLNPDMNIIDIGANIGYYVLLEANIVKKGKGKIIAIEPFHENVQYLRLNVENNNYQHFVNIIEGAVTETSGNVELALSPCGNCHRLRSLSLSSSDKTVEVQAYTLKEIISNSRIPIENINFIRMDVEGAEYMILPTIYDILSKMNHIYMFIEFHPHVDLESHQKVVMKLEDIGFKAISVTKEYIKDGVILRQHVPDVKLSDIYLNDFYTQAGGCETFLLKNQT